MEEVLINYSAVLVSAVAAFFIGFLWYGPIFGKLWMRLSGITMEGMKAMKMTPVMAMIGGFLLTLLMAYVFAPIVIFGSAYLGTYGAWGGAVTGFWIWLGFALPLTAGVYLWEGKPFKLWVLNAAHWLVVLLVMGAILGGWQ